MSPHFSSESATGSLPDTLDVHMLHEAQMYLKCRELRQIPSTEEDQAWEWFFQTYDPRMRHWALGCHVRPGNVKDCLQEVWIDVVKKLPAFAADGTQRGLCSWLHAIVHAKAVDLLRYQVRHPATLLRPEAEAVIASPEAGPVANYEQQRRQEAVQRILAELRRKVSALSYRACFMHWIEKKTIEKIAAELNVTQRVVRRRMCKAKRTFALLCEQDEDKDLLTDG